MHEAERIINQIEGAATNQVARSEAAPIVSIAPVPSQRGRWTELLGANYRSRTLIVWALWAAVYFVSNGLNNWLPSLYSTVYRLPLQQSLRAASMTNVAQVAILLVCVFCIDRIGRKKWMSASLLAGAGALLILGLFGSDSVRTVMVLATFGYGVVGSANAVLYLYTPEIYPTRMRAIGTGLATCWLRLASALGPVVVGAVISRKGTSSVFLMFALAAVVGAVAATRMIETRARRLEAIAS